MPRAVIALILAAVLAIGGGLIAVTAYQAGAATVVTTTTATGATVVSPVVVPAYGYGFGWHPYGFGFGIFGFLGTLLFVFIVFGLIRALVFRGGPRHRGGWGGPGGPGGSETHGRSPWESRAHETFEEWHGRAHAGGPDAPTGTPTPPAPPRTDPT
jgi:hypothetical protein